MKFWLSDSSNGVTTTLYSGIIVNCSPSYQLSSLVALWADSSPFVMKVDTRGCNSRCFPRRLVVISQCYGIRLDTKKVIPYPYLPGHSSNTSGFFWQFFRQCRAMEFPKNWVLAKFLSFGLEFSKNTLELMKNCWDSVEFCIYRYRKTKM